MKFINPLLVSRFSLSFYMDADATLDGMDIVLTDYYDRAKTAVISFNDGEGSAASVAVNGAASAIASSWKGRNFVVSCDGSYVYFDGSATGANFGFSSDMCLLDVRFRSVKKVSRLTLRRFAISLTANRLRTMQDLWFRQAFRLSLRR